MPCVWGAAIMTTGKHQSKSGESIVRPVAMITGGTSGIGFGIAECLAGEFDLALCFASNSARAEEAKDSILRANPNCRVEIFGVPLKSDTDCEQLHLQVRTAMNADVEVLVNAAGQLRDGLFLSTEKQFHLDTIQEHLSVPLILSHLVLPAMYRNKSGRIINISSITSRRYKLGQVNYATAKAGLEGMTKALAREVAHRGITVNAIAPGLIATPMTQDLISRAAEKGIKIRSLIPAGYVGSPSDVGALAAFLVSENARYLTGQVIDVCGGRSLVGE
jgi:3-oxoacyl-[acyl-carrier protein] reductase